MNLQLLLLTLCQGLFLTNNVVFIAINGLVGLQLAPTAWLATLPLTAYVLGGALSAPLVARHQRRYGRKRTFQAGLLVAVATTLLCALAAWQRSFGLLLLGTVLAGYYQANASLYRFAAAELVAPAAREKAISWVLAGGILGGVFGPNLASATREALPQAFAGSYLALVAVAVLALALISLIRFP
ncbi:MAG: MFS transporter, partial [Burkholderiales bacterium]|nr:MFS transporter [Burkholderiales bacterium]